MPAGVGIHLSGRLSSPDPLKRSLDTLREALRAFPDPNGPEAIQDWLRKRKGAKLFSPHQQAAFLDLCFITSYRENLL